MIDKFITLYRDKKELSMLETSYFAIATISFFVSGTVALFNQSLGISLLIVPAVCLISGIMNIIVWALFKLFAETMDQKQSKSSKK